MWARLAFFFLAIQEFWSMQNMMKASSGTFEQFESAPLIFLLLKSSLMLARLDFVEKMKVQSGNRNNNAFTRIEKQLGLYLDKTTQEKYMLRTLVNLCHMYYLKQIFSLIMPTQRILPSGVIRSFLYRRFLAASKQRPEKLDIETDGAAKEADQQ